MKILQVNCVYRKGSTGKIVFDIHSSLKDQGYESVVCYGRKSSIQEVRVYKFCSELEAKTFALLSRFGWLQYAASPIATMRLKRIILKEKPDIVHLHCLNGFCVNIYSLLTFLAKEKIKTIVTHHAEFLYTGSCGHSYDCKKWYSKNGCFSCPILKEATYSFVLDNTHWAWEKMLRSFTQFSLGKLRFTAVSPWVVGRSQLSSVLSKYPCTFVTNGLNTAVFKPAGKDYCDSLRNRLPMKNVKIVLHVTASFTTAPEALKGGRFILELAKRMPEHLFVVVATYIGNVSDLPVNVYIWGKADGQSELAALYTLADLTVIVSKRETFSMVVAESLCCGSPVVGFEAGGPESIAILDYSEFVEYGDVSALNCAIAKRLNTDKNVMEISIKAHERYSRMTMTDGYIKVYRTMLAKNND